MSPTVSPFTGIPTSFQLSGVLPSLLGTKISTERLDIPVAAFAIKLPEVASVPLTRILPLSVTAFVIVQLPVAPTVSVTPAFTVNELAVFTELQVTLCAITTSFPLVGAVPPTQVESSVQLPEEADVIVCEKAVKLTNKHIVNRINFFIYIYIFGLP